MLFDAGVPTYVIRSIVGHGSLQVTDRYARSTDFAVDLARKILDAPDQNLTKSAG
jgi:hypothetical protein